MKLGTEWALKLANCVWIELKLLVLIHKFLVLIESQTMNCKEKEYEKSNQINFWIVYILACLQNEGQDLGFHF